MRLILWILSLGAQLSASALPDVAELYSGWCWGTVGRDPITPVLLRALYR